MLLPSLISLHRQDDEPPSAEDIFSSSLGGIFADDLQNAHGDDPFTTIIYRSEKYGDLELRTADVNGEEQRRKFAHYLWNAGILMAEFWWINQEEEKLWSMKGQIILELGAGVGLAGIASALSGAQQVVVSDYPAPVIINTLKKNVSMNVPEDIQPRVSVEGHQWGELDTPFAQANRHHFVRILAADCYWMQHEHENLAKSMRHFLSKAPEARVHCIGGFHTGRANLASFFEEVVPSSGLEVEDIYEMDANGGRREWAKERDGGKEDVTGRKRWLVVARLRRRASS
ncbi:putative methyltransferase-domain-containing protein [Lophiotrema nucula]|uniref:Putative methyltransferase-domain-containing protein n=1 Tax=Lophiotrema nucula TaxID=690887 RepID=A0A6A5YGD8_9PLEO|nr:putative methyltransferase-domain-containing protein [Lophiotrema nucula]